MTTATNETEENFMVDDYRMCVWTTKLNYGVGSSGRRLCKVGGPRRPGILIELRAIPRVRDFANSDIS
jgi:hypothetical protein